MSNILKCTEKLIKLKELQQQSVMATIAKLELAKEEQQKAVTQIDWEIENNIEQKEIYSKNFYQEIKVKIFSNRDVIGLHLVLDQFRVMQEELVAKRRDMVEELAALEDKIKETKKELRVLLVKEEKYKLFITEGVSLRA